MKTQQFISKNNQLLLIALLFFCAFVDAQNLISHYDFNNNFSDKLGGSVLDKFGVTSVNLQDNATSSFGNDANGNFWQWEASASSTRGGGLWIDLNSDISTSYSIGVRFSFTNTQSGYRKIIDYKNMTSDMGFYFYSGGKFLFYPYNTLGESITLNNQVVDVIVTRAANKEFKAYIINNGVMSQELSITDANNYAIPTLVNGKPRFRFFHDEVGTSSEASRGGKVYSIKVWDGPITQVEAETAMEVKDFEWVGGESTAPNAAANWKENLTPGTNVNITVPKLNGANVRYPLLNTNMSIANLHLHAGAKITVDAISTVSLADKVLIESNDLETAQFFNSGNVANSAKVVFRKEFKAASNWYFVSFPYDVTFSNIKLANTETTATTGNFYTAVSPFADFYVLEYNGQRRDQTGTAVASNSPNWDIVTSGTLQAGKGYAILVKSDKSLDFVSSSAVSGLFDKSNKSLTVGVYTNNANAIHHGWNLVGVPYSSSFNLNNLNQGPFYYTYNRSAQNYLVHENGDNSSLYPFEAFFLQASNSNLNFSTVGRALKAPLSSANKAFKEFDLVLSNNTYTDRTRIRLQSEAQLHFEKDKDAVKMLSMNAAVPQIWTVSKGVDMAVNAVPEETNEMFLTYKLAAKGNYTLELKNKEQLLHMNSVWLFDVNTGKQVDISSEPYTFYSNAGTFNSRFKLLLQPDVQTSISSYDNGDVRLVKTAEALIFSGLKTLSDVKVYDVAGKLLVSYAGVDNAQPLYIANAKGTLIIQVFNSEQNLRMKVGL